MRVPEVKFGTGIAPHYGSNVHYIKVKLNHVENDQSCRNFHSGFRFIELIGADFE